MKKAVILILIICCSSFVHASDISDSFTQKYNSLFPLENSSVDSDYLYEQIALGSQYTIILLDQLNTNNDTLNEKVDTLNEKVDIMIEKFSILIEQNRKIIYLLEKSKKDSDS
ncbi:MAG: hypothetical protein PF690_00555 [Deltaproteobacteria bacterium]|jgi:hypothetical protein|nr:hypothetical protein [Deltaproteobacteria bacterium]